jgi:ribosome maturation protein Sdo1
VGRSLKTGKIKEVFWTRRVAQVVEHLLSKGETQSSNPSTKKKKKAPNSIGEKGGEAN